METSPNCRTVNTDVRIVLQFYFIRCSFISDHLLAFWVSVPVFKEKISSFIVFSCFNWEAGENYGLISNLSECVSLYMIFFFSQTHSTFCRELPSLQDNLFPVQIPPVQVF